MPYRITNLKASEKGRVELCLNETISLWLYAREARSLSLEEGMELSEEEYQNILHETIGKRAIKRAMHLLERQERTERQLREKLLQSAYPEEAIEDAVSYVKKYHYLDDVRYARTFICFHQEKRSRMRIRNDLMRRGIPNDVIEVCMEEEFVSDEREQIARWLEKKGFSPDEADQNEYRKMYQFLMRRGFRSSDISAEMRRMRQDGQFDSGSSGQTHE